MDTKAIRTALRRWGLYVLSLIHILNEMKDLRHELEKFKEQASLGEARSFLASAKTVGELKVITAQRDGMDLSLIHISQV